MVFGTDYWVRNSMKHDGQCEERNRGCGCDSRRILRQAARKLLDAIDDDANNLTQWEEWIELDRLLRAERIENGNP